MKIGEKKNFQGARGVDKCFPFELQELNLSIGGAFNYVKQA